MTRLLCVALLLCAAACASITGPDTLPPGARCADRPYASPACPKP